MPRSKKRESSNKPNTRTEQPDVVFGRVTVPQPETTPDSPDDTLLTLNGYQPPIESKYDYLFKFKLVGDSGVGKSSLLLRFADNTFSDSFISTIGVDFKIKIINPNGAKCKLQIWDTAGQERFRVVESAYARGSHAYMVVFDLTNRESFYNVRKHVKNVRDENKEAVIMLVGAKLDLEDEYQVSTDNVKDLLEELNIQLYYETSAKTSQNVDEAFEKLTTEVQKGLEKDVDDDLIVAPVQDNTPQGVLNAKIRDAQAALSALSAHLRGKQGEGQPLLEQQSAIEIHNYYNTILDNLKDNRGSCLVQITKLRNPDAQIKTAFKKLRKTPATKHFLKNFFSAIGTVLLACTGVGLAASIPLWVNNHKKRGHAFSFFDNAEHTLAKKAEKAVRKLDGPVQKAMKIRKPSSRY